MTFLREHPDQTLLVHAARRPAEAVEIPLRALGPDPDLDVLVGEAATAARGALTLPGTLGVSVHAIR